MHPSALHPALRWTATLLYTLLYLILLLQPQAHPVIDTGIPPGPPSLQRELFFSLGHVVLSAGLGLLLVWSLVPSLPLRAAVLLMLMGIAVFGLTTEWAQSLTADRGPSLLDWAADVAGGLLVLGAVGWRNIKK